METGELLEAALGAVADGVVIIGPDGSPLYANEAFVQMWGISDETLREASHASQLEPFMDRLVDPAAFIRSILEPDIEDPETSATVRSKDGRVLEVLSRPLSVQGLVARVLSFRDVTARASAEQDLRTESIRRETLLQKVPAALYEDIVDDDAPAGVKPVYMGEQIEAMTGYPSSAFIEDPELWENIVHPDDREGVVEANRDFYQEPDPLGQVCRVVAADGRVVWVHDWAQIVPDPVTGKRHVFGVIQDITHVHEAEQRALDAEARWRAIVEEVPGVVYRHDAMGGLDGTRYGSESWVSPSVEEFIGHTQEECSANPDIWVDLLHPDDRAWVVKESERTDLTGEPFDAEYRLVLRDGTVRWVHDRAIVVGREDDGDGRSRWWQGLIMDVTERRTLQQRILDAQEQERASVARAIEDTSMQAMAAAGLRASVALARAGAVDDPGSAAVQMAIEEAISSLRRLLFELRPISLDRGGLSDAAGEYLRLLADGTGSELRLEDRLVSQPAEPLRTVAYRVIQAIGRATLGAGLGTAFLLEPSGGGMRLVAATATSPIENVDELALARERARSVGGRVDIAEDGASVEAWLPLSDDQE